MEYTISGTVIRGEGYGRKIGFPTVNIATTGMILPAEGIYAGTAILEGKEYCSGIVVGPGEKVEAHLIGYAGDAYGKEVTIRIEKFLREFRQFDTEDALSAQIRKDLEECT